jgi:two-component system, response regulator PdtaR
MDMKNEEAARIFSVSTDARPRVLVVEDEVIIALDLAAILRRHGCEVSAMVTTGEASIIEAEAGRPDLVLMDINLKGDMNGVQAAHEIHSRWGIPVVYLTAYSEDVPGLLGRVNGLPRLLKPFDDLDIEEALEKYLPRRNN